jgi:HEAT repeat protein
VEADMSRILSLLALALAACSAAVGPADADGVLDRHALIEDRQAALTVACKEGRTAAVRDALVARVVNPKEVYGERRTCVALCADLGADARPAVAALLPVLATADPEASEGLVHDTADALTRIAPDDERVFASISALAAKDTDSLFPGSWAKPLARCGERAKPVLVGWFHSEDAATRMMAVQAMAEAGPWARPHLLAAMSDPEHWVSASAIDALIRSGAPAADVLPTLLTRLDSPDRQTAISAMHALGRFGPAATEAAPKIRARTTGGDPYEDVVRAHSLFRITGEVDEAAVLRVASALSVPNVPVHHRAAEALRDFGPKSKPALPQIAKAMRRLTRGTRAVLCDAIARIGSKDGVPALVGVLRGERDDDTDAIWHTDDEVGFDDDAAAIRALVSLHATEALPDIRKVQTWEDRPPSDELRRLRRLASEAVSTLGG